ncbi:MAG: helix-turn-helix domain-containing protein [Micromonosporaceae bacterium]
MVLLRRVLGDALRSRRLDQDRTLRDVSTNANVSLGYLSEIERGQKEASSELLASICDALDTGLSEVLREASGTMALAEEMAQMMEPEAAPVEPSGDGVRMPEAKLSTSIELSIESPEQRRDVVCAA